MGLTNCFALCQSSGQFEYNNTGCHNAYDPEEKLPIFPNVKSDDIILYQYKSIWSLDLNDVDNYTPVKYTTINKDMDYSLSQMLKNRLPSHDNAKSLNIFFCDILSGGEVLFQVQFPQRQHSKNV